MSRTLAEFARDCGGVLHGADAPFGSVCTDTRKLAAGQLFVALDGPNFRGSDFLVQAAAAGAAGAVADAAPLPSLPTIVVANGLVALQRAASALRARHDIPVVAVAGSNGKTTCKEMLAAILAQRGATLATRGNLNNHIGVPLTLLDLQSVHRHAVIEMGANRAGDVTELAGFAQPTVGIVTNAGAEHLEGFGSIEGAARAEGELFAALPADGVAVLNADDEFAALWRDMTVARIVTFGLGAKADFTARDVRAGVESAGFVTRFTLCTPGGEIAVVLHLAGKHNVINALGAAAAAMAAGATLADVAAGLARMRAVGGRLQWRAGLQGASLIDDSYNANPSSMHAAIDVLESLAGRRWLVMGDMAELGSYAVEAHAEAGRYARAHGVERMFAIGALTPHAVKSFGAGAEWFADAAAVAAAVARELAPDVRILVKGSRMNRLERVVESLTATLPAARSA